MILFDPDEPLYGRDSDDPIIGRAEEDYLECQLREEEARQRMLALMELIRLEDELGF